MLYEVVLRQEYYSQTIINRFNYVGAGVPAAVSGSFALIAALGFIPDNSIYPAAGFFNILRGQLATTLRFVSVDARAIYDVVDFYERPFVSNLFGVRAGEPMAPFMSYGFRTNRVRQDIGRGTKRFAGTVETQVGAGGNIETGMVSQLQELADVMSDVLTYDDEGNTLTFSPCIVKKEKYHPPTSPTNWAYRYWANEATQMADVALGIAWDPYITVRSQTSRQYGRGS